MKDLLKMELKPTILFDHFLHKLQKARELPELYVGSLHQAFYGVALRYPEEMGAFDFLLRTEPYCSTLTDLVWEFVQANHFLQATCLTFIYSIKPSTMLPMEVPSEQEAVYAKMVNELLHELMGKE